MSELNKLWNEYLEDRKWWSLRDVEEHQSFGDFMLWYEQNYKG